MSSLYKPFTSICFISGHVNLSQEEFETHYVPALDVLIHDQHKVVLGCAKGADTMCLDYLVMKGYPVSKITVYVYDRYKTPIPDLMLHYTTKYGVEVLYDNKWTSYEDRDADMTWASDCDLCWIRSEDETKRLLGKSYNPKRISGTQKNLNRRKDNIKNKMQHMNTEGDEHNKEMS
jgi:hypothetical protein